jgi:NADH-quinone oxidoreductase subunit C
MSETGLSENFPSGTWPTVTLAGKEAVLKEMAGHPALAAIMGTSDATLLAAFEDARWDRGELTLTIAREGIVAACLAVQKAGYNFLEDLTAVDWFPASPRFQVTYQILSHAIKQYVRLRVMLDEASPAVQTVTSVFPSANYYEREVFDLFGIRFDEHPNLRRIMMPEEWVGHPLRKDYPVEGYR